MPSATAILDRFLHHAEILSISGKSYRLRNRAAADQPDDSMDPATGRPAEDSKPTIPPTGTVEEKQVKKASWR